MKHRGKKSGAELASVSTMPSPKTPPPVLTEYQAEVWASVVATKPADWFGSDTDQLLVAYCKHSSIARDLDRLIDAMSLNQLKRKDGFAKFQRCVAMRETQTRAIAMLSRSMRLTQQSKYDRQKKRDVPTNPKPWEN